MCSFLNAAFQVVDLFFQTYLLVIYACIYFVCELIMVTFVHRSVLDNFHAAIKVVNDPDFDAVGRVLHLTQDAINFERSKSTRFANLLRGSYEVQTFFMFFFPL